MNDLTEIIYMDCNRQNSISSSSNPNEWEYRIGNEALTLPTGTQVSIQNSLINKRGLTGGSIVIDNDIDENVSVCYYTTDNEMWRPVGSKVADPDTDTADYEDLYLSGRQAFTNSLEDDDLYTNPIPLYAGYGEALPISGDGRPGTVDARRTGFSEAPMMMLTRELMPGSEVPVGNQNRWDNGILMPKSNNILIFIPKGVYGVSELAQLVEDQFNGKLRGEDIKANGNYSSTSFTHKLQQGTYDGMLDNETTYIKVATTPLLEDSFQTPYNPVHINGYTSMTTTALSATDTTITTFTEFSVPGKSGTGTAGDPFTNTSVAQGGHILIPETQEIIAYNGVAFVNDFGNGGGTEFQNCIRGQFGTTALPIPIDCYIEMYWGTDANRKTTFIPPSENMGLFTHAPAFNRVRDIILTPPTNGQSVYESRRGILYKNNTGGQIYNPPPAPMARSSVRPVAQGIPNLNWGTNYFRYKNQIPLISHRNDDDVAINNTEFDYNVERFGYYVGTPSLKVSFDTNSSSYVFNNLHQPWRIPAYDQYGNEIESAGEEAVMLKRACRVVDTPKWGVGDVELNPHYINPAIKQSLQQPVQRYGGISVYNWGFTTARKYGDKDWTNPDIYNQDSTRLLRFDEYFTTDAKAKEAWKKTIWYRMGFGYDQFVSPTSYENNKYYNHPLDEKSRVFGTTTRADLSVDSLSSVSTAYNPTVAINKDIVGHLAPRLYNNMDINTPIRESGVDMAWISNVFQRTDKSGKINNIYCYFSSFWQDFTGTIILTASRPLRALNLPILNEQGYYLITTDMLDAHEDSVKNGKNMPILGIVPLSGLATNDFLNSIEPLVHIINQEKILNSIKFKVLYPNLTNPDIDENSSVLLKIVRPVQQIRQNPDKKT